MPVFPEAPPARPALEAAKVQLGVQYDIKREDFSDFQIRLRCELPSKSTEFESPMCRVWLAASDSFTKRCELLRVRPTQAFQVFGNRKKRSGLAKFLLADGSGDSTLKRSLYLMAISKVESLDEEAQSVFPPNTIIAVAWGASVAVHFEVVDTSLKMEFDEWISEFSKSMEKLFSNEGCAELPRSHICELKREQLKVACYSAKDTSSGDTTFDNVSDLWRHLTKISRKTPTVVRFLVGPSNQPNDQGLCEQSSALMRIVDSQQKLLLRMFDLRADLKHFKDCVFCSFKDWTYRVSEWEGKYSRSLQDQVWGTCKRVCSAQSTVDLESLRRQLERAQETFDDMEGDWNDVKNWGTLGVKTIEAAKLQDELAEHEGREMLVFRDAKSASNRSACKDLLKSLIDKQNGNNSGTPKALRVLESGDVGRLERYKGQELLSAHLNFVFLESRP